MSHFIRSLIMTAIPFPTLSASQNSRISRLRQVIALTIVSICLCGFAAVRAVYAEAPPTGTLTAVPTDGRPRGLQLRSQTVDVTIRQTPDGMLADTILWVKFSNPGKQTVSMPLALGGPQLGPRALPQILDVTLDNRPIALESLEPFTARVDGGPIIAYTLPITVPLKGSATLRVRYNQVLAEQEGLISYTYPITATARWSGTPESLRITVKFDPSLPADQILSRTPAGLRAARDGITWTWDAQRPKTSIGASLMSPAWWRDYAAARTAAAAPDAGLTEHLALSDFYRRLSKLPPPAFDSATDYYNRYFPSEVAELQAALKASDRSSPTKVAAIHLRLAEIYLGHAERLGLGSDSAYLQSAATELEAAIALDNADATVRSTAISLYAQLAQAAGARGDQATAAQHLARVAALDATGSNASPEALAQATLLVRANEALARGDLRAARQLVAEGFGAGAVTRTDAPPPRAGQALVTVTTTAGERDIIFRLVGGNPSAISALLADTASALAGVSAVRVSTAGDRITVAIPYTDGRGLMAIQAKLAAALPDEPELALLGAVLSPRQLAWENRSGLLGSSVRYVERIDLGPAWQAWEARAHQIEAAGFGQDAPGTTNSELARLQRAFWADDAAAWRKLAAESQVDYRVKIASEEPEKHWEAAAGATRMLEAEARSLMPAQIALLAGIAVCLLVSLVLAAWLLI
jgi:hypothetical protein